MESVILLTEIIIYKHISCAIILVKCNIRKTWMSILTEESAT